MTESTRFVPFTAAEYSQSLRSFIELSDNHEKMKGLIDPVIRKFEGKPIHFMSIGAGNGNFDGMLINEKCLTVDFFYGIEPDDDRRKELQKRVLSWNIDHFIDESCFDEFFETEIKFDLILMSHVLYFISKPIESILKAMSFLKGQGRLVIIHDDKGGLPEVYSTFLQLLDSCSLKKEDFAALTISKLSDDMCSSGITHVLSKGTYRLDVTEFVEKTNTPKVIDLVSFMLQTRFDKLPTSIQEDVYKMVKEGCIQDGNNKHYFPNPFGMIVVTKSI